MNAMFALKSNNGNKEDENYLVALFVHLCYSQCPFLYIVVTLRSTSRQQKNTGYNNNSCFHAWPIQVYYSMYLAPDLPLLSGDGSDTLSLGCSLLLLLLVNSVVHVRIGHLVVMV